MGGPGSGNPGQARGAGGRFVIAGEVAITTAEAVEGVQKLDKEVEKLTDSVEKSSDAIDENTKETNENTDSKKKNKEETEDLKKEQFELQIALQLTVSALNQTTGALLKVVGALEQLGAISDENAEATRRFISRLEILVGVLEFVLSVFLLFVTTQYILNSGMVASAIGTGGLTVAMLGLGKAVAITLLHFAPLLIFLAAIAYGFKILIDNFKAATVAADMLNEGLDRMEDLVNRLINGVRGLGSVFDKFNPLSAGRNLGKLVSGGL